VTRVPPHFLRVAGTLALCVALTTGAREASAETDPTSESSLDAFFARRLAELDAWIPAKMDALTDEAVNAELATLAGASERRLAQAIARQTEMHLAMRMQETRRLAMGEAVAGSPADGDARMTSGSLAVPGGVSSGRHRFDEPFGETPNIALSVRPDGATRSGRPSVTLRILNVDETGFEYEVRSADGAPLRDVTADWVAYSGRASAPAAIR